MKKRLSEREGGQFLILPPEAVADSGEDGALSIRTPGSSLHHKGMKSLMRNHSPTLEMRVLCPLPASDLCRGIVSLPLLWQATPCVTGCLAQPSRRPCQGTRSSAPPSLPGRSPPVAGCAPRYVSCRQSRGCTSAQSGRYTPSEPSRTLDVGRYVVAAPHRPGDD